MFTFDCGKVTLLELIQIQTEPNASQQTLIQLRFCSRSRKQKSKVLAWLQRANRYTLDRSKCSIHAPTIVI
jgi:hypothetical protein